MKPLLVGIAGASRGSGFVAGLAALPGDVRLHAVYDPDEQARAAFAREHQLEHAVGHYTQLLDLCDLVILSSPQQFHAPQAVAALDRGVHVLSEVPAVVSLDQAHDLLAAVRRSNARYALAENYCYIRSNLIVREMARAGVFGELYLGEAEYLHEMKHYHHQANGDPTWRYHWQVGRNMVTYPTHSLGPLLQWFDDRLVAVSCVGTGRHTDPEHAMDDSVVMLGRTARGALIRIRLDLLSNRPHLMDYYAIQGTEGSFEAPRFAGGPHNVHIAGVSGDNEWEPVERHADRYLPERYRHGDDSAGHWGADRWPIIELVEAIRADAQPELDIYRALDMSLPGVVSEASMAQNGAWVAVPDPRYLTAGIGVDPGHEGPLS